MENKFMNEAIKEAKKAYLIGEVPVGCVIVKDNIIIARAYNKKEKLHDPTAHAELLAIKKACKKLNNWRLDGASIYVTLEPCAMCMGAIMQSHISQVYFGAKEKSMGSCGSKINLSEINFQNPTIKVISGIEEEKCIDLLKSFFKELRNQ